MSSTYNSAQEYIDALNENGNWVVYDPDTNTATITSIGEFVAAMKVPTKYDGAGTSDVAPYFRIRTGLSQGDTALCMEVNLALALAEHGSDVDFEIVWGAGHTEAECTGDSKTNFIAWIKDCLQQYK